MPQFSLPPDASGQVVAAFIAFVFVGYLCLQAKLDRAAAVEAANERQLVVKEHRAFMQTIADERRILASDCHAIQIRCLDCMDGLRESQHAVATAINSMESCIERTHYPKETKHV